MRIDGNNWHDRGDEARVNRQPRGAESDATGTVSNEEHSTSSTRGHRRWSDADVFQRADANQDGVLNAEEFSSGLDELRSQRHHHHGRRSLDATRAADRQVAPQASVADASEGVDAEAVWRAYDAADSTDYEYDGIVSLGNLVGGRPAGALEHVFEGADADADGVITEAEVEAVVGAPSTPRDARFALDDADVEAARNAYLSADSADWEADGIVSLGNLVGGRPAGKLEHLFNRADDDLDGVVTADELEVAIERSRQPVASPVSTEPVPTEPLPTEPTDTADVAPGPAPATEDGLVPTPEPTPVSVATDAPVAGGTVEDPGAEDSPAVDTTADETPAVAVSAVEASVPDEPQTISLSPTVVEPAPEASTGVTLVQAANQALAAMLEAVEDATEAASKNGSVTTVFMAALISYTRNSGATAASPSTFQASA